MARLPFLDEPDIGLGIALRTFFDEDELTHSKEQRAGRLEEFPKTYLPFAEAIRDDFHLCTYFVDSLYKGIQILDDEEVGPDSKAAWASAQAYLEARPF